MSNENVKVEKVKVEKVSAHQPAFVDVNSFAIMDKECSALGGLFQSVVNDMKGSYIVFEDFAAKALKLHQHLKVTSLAAAAFLDSFQRVADMATGTK
ncbi:PREDICTED: MTSS1-like protein, partial [Priapulus caudatus]|uniref:MTSS1-like protein n=1 Tax=Priapulus caudatus TaxID=37621 RepID=A0ABM1F2E9_PRICU